MAWNGGSVVEQRLALVRAMRSGLEDAGEACGRFGVSRKTGYKWLGRYEAEGVEGLIDRGRAPHRHGRASAAEVVQAIVELKCARPTWGPRKLAARLAHLYPQTAWPSHSTVGEILKREGLGGPARRRRRHAPPTRGPLTCPERPNQVWAADHKGWVRLGEGGRLEPLTVVDRFSRYLVALEASSGADARQARQAFERAFAAHGLPEIIQSDNGTPFASSGVSGLTALSAWWVSLGIRLERIAPGKPQQNGRCERLNGTLIEAMAPPETDRARQQARFDAFRQVYNEERPHEALGQKPPATVFAPSPRALSERPPEPDYPAGAAVRGNGCVKWRGEEVFVCTALAGQPIALIEDEASDALVRYCDLAIGLIPRDDPNMRRPAPNLSPSAPVTLIAAGHMSDRKCLRLGETSPGLRHSAKGSAYKPLERRYVSITGLTWSSNKAAARKVDPQTSMAIGARQEIMLEKPAMSSARKYSSIGRSEPTT